MSQAPPFPPARVVPLGGGAKLIFCSGVTARGSAAAGGTVQDQARECLARLERALAGEGATLSHLLKITTWLCDMRHYDGFNEVRRAAFDALATPPASTCVGGAQFTTTDVCIEIEGIAVLPGARMTLAGHIRAESARLAALCTACGECVQRLPDDPLCRGGRGRRAWRGGVRDASMCCATAPARRKRWPGSPPAPAAGSARQPARNGSTPPSCCGWRTGGRRAHWGNHRIPVKEDTQSPQGEGLRPLDADRGGAGPMAVSSDRAVFWYGCNMTRHGEVIRATTRLLEARRHGCRPGRRPGPLLRQPEGCQRPHQRGHGPPHHPGLQCHTAGRRSSLGAHPAT